MNKIIRKPWGYEKILEYNNRYCMKMLVVDPNQSLSRQYHKVKHETMVCVQGYGFLEIGFDSNPIVTQILDIGTDVVIPPMTIHKLIAGENGIRIIEASTPELDDVVRLEDQYGRT